MNKSKRCTEIDASIDNNHISSTRKRAFLNLLIMPLFLIGFGCLGFFLWQISIKWVSAPESKAKLFWVAIGLLLILVEIILTFFALRFTHWALSRKSIKNTTSGKK